MFVHAGTLNECSAMFGNSEQQDRLCQTAWGPSSLIAMQHKVAYLQLNAFQTELLQL